ncbi:FAR1-RELATED SEQUENCE 5-like [Olea europaea subsp. europaea]|uniref:FAR1-RELATED SEQUENCE 5-like n=1 Tax=Olea europaea subsp. europaea TaxID=158383 RepID=A0A8S0TIY0_OLEEU|nr:FAR1-RELATED SEQUENCE 5-like [Olea europaea subsp. europaea]
MKYIAEVGSSPIEISHDRDVFFYLNLKERDAQLNSFPICLEIKNGPMEEILPLATEDNNHLSHAKIQSPPHEIHPDPQLNDQAPGNMSLEITVDDVPYDMKAEGNNALQHLAELIATADLQNEANYRRQITDNNVELSVINGLSNAQISVEERSAEGQIETLDSDEDLRMIDESENVRDMITEVLPTVLRVKNIYPSKEVLKKQLGMLAIRNHFQFKVKRSTRRVLHVVCVDPKCKWTVRATKLERNDRFVVKRYDASHTCSPETVQGDHRQASSCVVGECVKRKYQLRSCSSIKPHDIINEMRQTYGVTITYERAWRARECALESLRGSYEEAYYLLAKYTYMLNKMNPGSVVALETEENNKFKYFFMCLAASIQGWQNCRPVILVDGNFLKLKYGGTLFTACAKDGNEQIFPLAFGIGDPEDAAAWEWFFVKLKEAIADREELVIISSFDKSICKAIEKVYPNADHGICTHHLLNNLKVNFRKAGKEMPTYFYNASRTYLMEEFEFYMNNLDIVNPSIRAYLQGQAGYEKWSRAFFSGRRYSIMTTDIARSINVTDVQAKDMPITRLIEWLMSMVQRWFSEYRSAAESTSTMLATVAEDRLREQNVLSLSMTVHPANSHEFHVLDPEARSFVVNLESKTCVCREFQVDQLPCSHALAAINMCKLSAYDYCSGYYKKEALSASYAATVHPLGNESCWVVPDEIKDRIILPPKWRRRSGRPRKRRNPKKTTKGRCSRCKEYGHNRKTCQNTISRDSNSSSDSSISESATNDVT